MTHQRAVSIKDYKNAMRHVASPVAVVTHTIGTKWAGLTATAICSATTEPPTILVCVNRLKESAQQIAEAGAFVVNFLTEEQTEIARHFSSSTDASGDAFDKGLWRAGANGAPILGGAVCAFDCVLDRVIPQGSHDVLFGSVLQLHVDAGSNLLYRDGFFRRLASY